MILDIESSLWKSDFDTFWQPVSGWIQKWQWFHLNSVDFCLFWFPGPRQLARQKWIFTMMCIYFVSANFSCLQENCPIFVVFRVLPHNPEKFLAKSGRPGMHQSHSSLLLLLLGCDYSCFLSLNINECL